jgi:hypothetical protein
LSGTEVTCKDIETGESETQIIEDNYVVITDGRCFISHIQSYPGSGTTVLTIKKGAADDE